MSTPPHPPELREFTIALPSMIVIRVRVGYEYFTGLGRCRGMHMLPSVGPWKPWIEREGLQAWRYLSRYQVILLKGVP